MKLTSLLNEFLHYKHLHFVISPGQLSKQNYQFWYYEYYIYISFYRYKSINLMEKIPLDNSHKITQPLVVCFPYCHWGEGGGGLTDFQIF